VADLWLDSPLIQSIGWALLHFVWQGAAIGLATAATLRALDRTQANARYLAACTGLALMILAPASSVLADRGTVPLESATLAAASGELVRSVSNAQALPVAVAGWMAGVVLLSIRLLASCIRVERLKRATRDVDEGIARRVRVLAHRLGVERAISVGESALVRVPTVVGCLRPVILLPASVVTGMPAAHLDALLAHELAHVRRHDYFVNVLQSIVETLLFYHPAVWWCSRQIRIEREHCCDDLVVEVCGDRLVYATALTQLEELRGLKPMLSLNANGGRLIDRVRRLLSQTPANEGRSTLWALAGSLTVVVIAIVLTPVFLTADAPRLPATPGQTASPLARPQSPELPALPEPLPQPPGIHGLLANDHDVAGEPPQFGDDPRRALEEALERLAVETRGIPAEESQFEDDPRHAIEKALRKLTEETGGTAALSQDSPPAPPAPPRVPRTPSPPAPAAPADPAAGPAPAAPAIPAAPAPPAPPQTQSLPVLPALPAAPAPPVPPGSRPQSLPMPPAAPVLPGPPAPPSEILQIDPDGLVREMRRASEQLGASFEDLRRAMMEINEKQSALQQAQAELAKMRVETLAANTKIEAVRNALVELVARSAALRKELLDDAEMRKQIESVRQALEDLRVR
jgi:beta-lactamase regulating signal transducer with metallopeptidase domain